MEYVLIERVYTCKACKKTQVTEKTTGRLPAVCPKCDPKKRRTVDRRAARNKTRREGKKRKVTAGDMHNAQRLAVGMSLHETVEDAARWAGIDPDVSPVEFFQEIAKKHYSEVTTGSVADLGKRMVSVMNLMLFTVLESIDEIAPRDRVAGLRQLASARDLLVGNVERAQFAQINLSVIGSDGEAVDLTATETGQGEHVQH
mgnify:FL=1